MMSPVSTFSFILFLDLLLFDSKQSLYWAAMSDVDTMVTQHCSNLVG